MTFPQVRMQRLRSHPTLRQMLSETKLAKEDLVAPVFIKENINEKIPVKAMPGVYQHSLKTLLKEIEKIAKVGIPSILLFGIPSKKDAHGSEAFNKEGIVQQAISMIKRHFPHLVIIADCCLCEYTSHGHCGIVEEGKLHNDKTLEILAQVAVSYASCGADVIAPSGMMDGMVGAIRHGLDQEGYTMQAILSYAVKYASCFYGPFREAGGAGDVFAGDRNHHQMAPSQFREALREVELDVEEGADFLMVKPALAYLDVIHKISHTFSLPIAAYQVSGEYSMLKAGAAAGLFDEFTAFKETLTSIKRAGAHLIISYYAVEMAEKL